MTHPRGVLRPWRSTLLQQITISWFICAAAIVVSFVTRLGWLGLIEFKNDESWALTIGDQIAHGRSLPAIGIGSSIGIPNAPFFVYLMAIPEVIGRNPAIATGFIGLLGVSAVAATYGLARQITSPIGSAVAALLYAVSPWGIVYSRKIWAQDALPAFVILGFWALLVGTTDKRRRIWLAPGLVCLTLATQLHPTAFALGFPAAMLIIGSIALTSQQRSSFAPPLGLGVAISLALESPFLIWQAHNGWPLVTAGRGLATGMSPIDLEAASWAVQVSIGNAYPTLANVTTIWRPATLIEGILLLGGVLILVQETCAASPRQRLVLLTFLCWIAAPIALQTRHSVPVYPHYFIVLYPVPFVLMGLAIDHLWTQQAGRVVASAAVAAVVMVGLGAFGQYIGALGRGDAQPAFGVPLAAQQALRKKADRLAAGSPIYFASPTDLTSSLSYLTGGRWRVYDDSQGLLLPGVTGTSVLVVDNQANLGERLAETWLVTNSSVRLRLTALKSATLVQVSGTNDASDGFRSIDRPFADGLTLHAYQARPDAAQRQVQIGLEWQLARPRPSMVPTVFNHLLDSHGGIAAQKDGLAYGKIDWQPGDLYLSEFDLAWPTTTGPYHLELGLYQYPSMQRYHLVDPAPGTPRDAVEVGPIVLPKAGLNKRVDRKIAEQPPDPKTTSQTPSSSLRTAQ